MSTDMLGSPANNEDTTNIGNAADNSEAWPDNIHRLYTGPKYPRPPLNYVQWNYTLQLEAIFLQKLHISGDA